MSWWDFGEHSGYQGEKLALYRIACAFCNEKGKLEPLQHHERKNGYKTLNFDIYRCGNCGNPLMIFWSASTTGGSQGIHDYKTLPWPRSTTSFPEHWPKDVGRYWMQARRSLEGKNWDAASLMARGAIQLVMRYQNAQGNNLKQEIDDLTKKGILPPIMQEWSHEVRQLGNDSAHPMPGDTGSGEKDANDVVEFLGVLLNMTYDLPNEINQYRNRKRKS